MILNSLKQIFSDMDWLDEELKRNELSEGRSECSDAYYNKLLAIKSKQQAGIIPFDEYKNLGHYEQTRTMEYGYYQANIYYDLFRYYKGQKEIIDDRIIFFLKNASNEIFEYEDNWFRLNFYSDYSHCLRDYYGIEESWQSLEDFALNSDNKKEKEIYEILWKNYMKKEYINEKINSSYCSSEINEYFIDCDFIDVDEFNNVDDFIQYSKQVIKDRVNIMRKYSVLSFGECKDYLIIAVNKLKGILIYCGKYDYDTQDSIFGILEDICGCNSWEIKYGIRLITDY